MSDGPPGGPIPGQPPEPWQGRSRHDPYGQPPQQWGEPDPWADPPPYGQQPGYSPYAEPGHGDDRGGYEPTRAYEPAGSEPARSQPARSDPPPAGQDGRGGRTQILVLVMVLALLVVGGGGTALYLLGRGEEPTDGQASARSSSAATSQASRPTGAPKTGTPAPRSSADARFVKVGQCVKNEGATSRPRLVITKCGGRTYQVLARFDGATTGERDAKAKCGKVTGYTDWYFFNSELDVLDFVLCLKLR